MVKTSAGTLDSDVLPSRIESALLSFPANNSDKNLFSMAIFQSHSWCMVENPIVSLYRSYQLKLFFLPLANNLFCFTRYHFFFSAEPKQVSVEETYKNLDERAALQNT